MAEPKVAAHMEHRLRQAVAPARGHARHPRGLRVEDRGAGADQRRGQQQQRVAAGPRQQHQAAQGEGHADRQRIGQGAAIGVETDQRLQQRGGELEDEGEQAHLGEAQRVAGLQHRVHGHSSGDCIRSLSRWQKLIAASTATTVSPVLRPGIAGVAGWTAAAIWFTFGLLAGIARGAEMPLIVDSSRCRPFGSHVRKRRDKVRFRA